MPTDSEVEARRDCAALVATITYFSDHGESDEAIELFAPDATWLRAGKLLKGRDEIYASLSQAHGGSALVRHMTGQPFVRVEGPDRATAVTYYVAYRSETNAPLPLPLETPFSMGEWHDKFVRTPKGWRFSYRETKRLFQRA